MHEDPLQELRDIRHHIEQTCAEQGQTYAEYLSQVQRKYSELKSGGCQVSRVGIRPENT